VASGAAIFAGMVDKISSVVLIDVVPLSVGVGMPGGAFKKLIDRHTTLPAACVFGVATYLDDQQAIELLLFQGEAKIAVENEYIGTLRIEGLPRGAKGSVQVSVNLQLDTECVLHVEVRQSDTQALLPTTMTSRYTSREVALKLRNSAHQPHDTISFGNR